ncbi:hypothetical protein F5B19DRAFT_440238 [Rostrohypoxylon terebratum]|nr:hypothetical protein F5B19DRAFT_440238 [Rostrohypoxylon terebratum]
MIRPSNAFTPINGQQSSLSQPAANSPTTDEQMQNRSSGSSTSKCQAQSSKRNAVSYEVSHEESRDTKRPKHSVPLLATPSSSPFQTLRVTKARSASNNFAFHKLEAETVNDRVSSHGQATDSRFRQGWNVAGPLTPHPTREHQESGDQLNHNSVAESAIKTDVICAPILTVSSSNAVDSTDIKDEYPLDDDLMEEDMTCLLDTVVENVRETHIPPSSVTQAWDHDSRSAVEYDPTLQYSSPFSSLEKAKDSQSASMIREIHEADENLLDDDVDWNAVYAITSTIPKISSAAGPEDALHSRPLGQNTNIEKPIEHNHGGQKATPLRPFVRPSFPEKIRDRPTVPGLSSDTVLRTCFRIGEMVNQAAHCLCHRQDAVFELFARVNYSNRENLQRRQHFQFMDLFKDQRPYPAGVLTNWRIGSQLDRQSSAFLSASAEPRICRCICKPIRDPKAAIGLILAILAIRETDWAQVEWAKHMVCGGPNAAT